MASQESLPFILVIAKTKTAACKLIADIVENEGIDMEGEDYTWHIENKYYEADVRMCGIGDEDCVPVPERDIEAVIIHLEDNEGVEEASRRLLRCGCGGRGVRLAARGAVDAALARWAAAQRLEPVAVGAAERAPGRERLRQALHAHVWRGLRLRDQRARTPPLYDLDGSSSDGGGGESDGDEAVERAEEFARVLAALPGAAGHAAALPRAERRAAAEALVQAVARALGRRL